MAIKNQIIRNINIHGIAFQLQLMFGLNTTPEANESLNEKWNVHDNSTPNPNSMAELPKVQYYGIGNRGHRNETIGDGFGDVELNQHRGSDYGLYGDMPFFSCLYEDDSPTIRSKYAMRVQRNINGEDRIFYFLKPLDTSTMAVEKIKVTNNNGTESEAPFVPDNSNLTPPPPEVPNPGNNPVNGVTLFALANLTISLTNEEITDIRDACELWFGDERYSYISEIQLVRASKSPVSLLDQSGQPTGVQYHEAIQACACFFIGGTWPIRYMDQVDVLIDAGGGVPELGPMQTTTVQNP